MLHSQKQDLPASRILAGFSAPTPFPVLWHLQVCRGRGLSLYICLAGVPLSLQPPGGRGWSLGLAIGGLVLPCGLMGLCPRPLGSQGPGGAASPLPRGPLPSVVPSSQVGLGPRRETDKGIKRK